MSKTELSLAKKTIINKLIETKCIKFGEFVLKSGDKSSYYVNLRETSMWPELHRDIVSAIKTIIDSIIEPSRLIYLPAAIVGVPYGVVPTAAAVAYAADLPYYPLRKETKDYGYKPDDNSYSDHTFIIIEDVMSSGSSIIETLKKLGNKRVIDVIVIVDRESGGRERLAAEYPDIRLHTILKKSEIPSLE